MIHIDPRSWRNPAFIRGTVFAAGGLAVLLLPDVSVKVLVYVGGGALLVSGASGLWGQRRAPGDLQGAVRGLLALAAGIGLLVAPIGTIRVFWVILAAYVAVAGLLALQRYVQSRRQGVAYRLHLARGAFMLSLATLLLTLPRAMFGLALASIAATAVLVGLAMVTWSLRRGAEKPNIADRGLAAEVFWDWFAERDMGPERRQAIAGGLYFEEPNRAGKITSYVVMLVLSVALASLAILQDSTAVIIGAMLVAPLMTPLMGCAAGLVAGWRYRVMESLGVVAASVVISVVVAWVVAAWIPALVPLEANSQVLSRASPTLVDMAIALAAGAAGAYATVDDRVSSSLTGVAIAVALVPPLGVVGIALEAGQWSQARGAFLLFGTNLVSVILASALVFVLVGLSPIRRGVSRPMANVDVATSVLIVALLIMVPLGLTGGRVLAESERLDGATTLVHEWLEPHPSLRLRSVEVLPGEVEIRLAGSGEVPSLSALEEVLFRELGVPLLVRVELFPSIVITSSGQQQVIEPGAESASPRDGDAGGVGLSPVAAPPADSLAIRNVTWEWVSTVTPVERIDVEEPHRYTVLLQDDGRAVVRFDCNGGGGSYELSPGRISFGPFMATRMACPEGSLDTRFMRDLERVTSYFLQDGELYLELPMDSGTLRFRRAP